MLVFIDQVTRLETIDAHINIDVGVHRGCAGRKKSSSADGEQAKTSLHSAGCFSEVIKPYGRGRGSFCKA